jgi:hypothetical protein
MATAFPSADCFRDQDRYLPSGGSTQHHGVFVSAEAESGREASREPTAICNNSLQSQQSVEHTAYNYVEFELHGKFLGVLHPSISSGILGTQNTQLAQIRMPFKYTQKPSKRSPRNIGPRQANRSNQTFNCLRQPFRHAHSLLPFFQTCSAVEPLLNVVFSDGFPVKSRPRQTEFDDNS